MNNETNEQRHERLRTIRAAAVAKWRQLGGTEEMKRLGAHLFDTTILIFECTPSSAIDKDGLRLKMFQTVEQLERYYEESFGVTVADAVNVSIAETLEEVDDGAG